MRVFNTLKEMEEGSVPSVILDYAKVLCENHDAVAIGDKPAEGDFEYAMGGAVFLVEADEDLSQIWLPQENPQNPERWLTPLDGVAVGTDIAAWLEGREFVMIWTATNNSGGPSYFIPKEIVERHSEVIEGIIKDSMNPDKELIVYKKEEGDADIPQVHPEW